MYHGDGYVGGDILYVVEGFRGAFGWWWVRLLLWFYGVAGVYIWERRLLRGGREGGKERGEEILGLWFQSLVQDSFYRYYVVVVLLWLWLVDFQFWHPVAHYYIRADASTNVRLRPYRWFRYRGSIKERSIAYLALPVYHWLFVRMVCHELTVVSCYVEPGLKITLIVTKESSHVRLLVRVG